MSWNCVALGCQNACLIHRVNGTVLELDLVGYSTICENLDSRSVIATVADFNRQIRAFIALGMEGACSTAVARVIAETGDGAILFFSCADDAHVFAEIVHTATKTHNCNQSSPFAKRVFRMGAASGEVAIEPKDGGGYDASGTAIARAVRLESKAQPGSLYVDDATYEGLAVDRKQRYSSAIRVSGKRDEQFNAHPCQLNSDGPRDAAFFLERGSPAKLCLSHLPLTGRTVLGRSEELDLLQHAWTDSARTRIAILCAPGGVGKTSLVKRWLKLLKSAGWSGAKRVFAWSFDSQGVSAERPASEDEFLNGALVWFGASHDPMMSQWQKGELLGSVVASQRSLIILDGIEPLQHPPGPLGGQLRAEGIESFLRYLAVAAEECLCVVTTRIRVKDTEEYERTDDYPDGSVTTYELRNLDDSIGARFLYQLGVRKAGALTIDEKDPELLQASASVRGHPLTLSLLGNYLRLAHEGDVCRRDSIVFEEADAETNAGHAFRVMRAYEAWFLRSGKRGERLVAALRMLGLFDRPADAACLDALRAQPTIAGLTDTVAALTKDQWRVVLRRLEESQLVESLDDVATVDAHPMVREYFASALQQCHPDAWRAGNERLYGFLTSNSPLYPEGVSGLIPLFQALGHGCRAGLAEQSLWEVYDKRIQRGDEKYALKKIGAFSLTLAGLACFFAKPWQRLLSDILPSSQGRIYNEAAVHLRILGRLEEALEPSELACRGHIEEEQWVDSAVATGNHAELLLSLGRLSEARVAAEQAIAFSERGDDQEERMYQRSVAAEVALCENDRVRAEILLTQARSIQRRREPDYPDLYAAPGFRYHSLLLADIERQAWTRYLGLDKTIADDPEAIHKVLDLAKRALDFSTAKGWKFAMGLQELTLGDTISFAELLQISVSGLVANTALIHLNAAVEHCKSSGVYSHVARSLRSRALSHALSGDHAGALADLHEAMRFAARGPMNLLLADLSLTFARIFRDKQELAKSQALIRVHRYARRQPELEDALTAASGWSAP